MLTGKIPPDLLERLLQRVPGDPRVPLGPRLGTDAALVEMGERWLAVATDPITFATDLIGWYAVQVNANDVACLGARPRWFLADILLPEGAEPSLAEAIFSQVLDACHALGVSLIGGHTEVTPDLPRPLVVGTMLGEVEKGKAVRPEGARPGDLLLLTKGIALEGTALLAREAGEDLRRRGVPEEVLERSRRLLFEPGISVVREALTACRAAPVHALHDPTEGGLAMGVWEMARAGGVGVEVEEEAVPVLPECREVCRALGLDPLGLLASGSLLLALAPEDAPRVREALEGEGVPVAVIGRVLEGKEGLRLRGRGGSRPLPTFARDEVARYLSGG